jgi:Ca2+-binding EF-hand superfamily protein
MDYQRVQNGRRQGQPVQASPGGVVDGELEELNVAELIMKKIRAKIIQRNNNTNSITSFARAFRNMHRGGEMGSKKGDGALSSYELHKALKMIGLNTNKCDCSAILKAMDTNNNGAICFNEFLTALRGEMNEFRLGFVQQAFDRICSISTDKGCTRNPPCRQCADKHDFYNFYDVSQHPDVVSGKMKPAEAMKEFMANFDLDGNGCVDIDEFRTYYKGVSASIDKDSYFELMMRNAWHISGGKGASENTSNLRVEVVFKDGHSEIIEVKDDFGLNRSDMRAIKTRLTKQGVSNIEKIKMTHGCEI